MDIPTRRQRYFLLLCVHRCLRDQGASWNYALDLYTEGDSRGNRHALPLSNKAHREGETEDTFVTL